MSHNKVVGFGIAAMIGMLVIPFHAFAFDLDLPAENATEEKAVEIMQDFLDEDYDAIFDECGPELVGALGGYPASLENMWTSLETEYGAVVDVPDVEFTQNGILTAANFTLEYEKNEVVFCITLGLNDEINNVGVVAARTKNTENGETGADEAGKDDSEIKVDQEGILSYFPDADQYDFMIFTMPVSDEIIKKMEKQDVGYVTADQITDIREYIKYWLGEADKKAGTENIYLICQEAQQDEVIETADTLNEEFSVTVVTVRDKKIEFYPDDEKHNIDRENISDILEAVAEEAE